MTAEACLNLLPDTYWPSCDGPRVGLAAGHLTGSGWPMMSRSSKGVPAMQIPRPTEADKERFRDLVPSQSNVEVKPMFGNLGAFVNGNMFMGLFGSDIGLKLSPADQESVRAAGGGDFGPPERPMGGFVRLPTSAQPERLSQWIGAALGYVADMPPKQPKARKR
jgi:TfoX/Sxy family transcriptional regulator of competence genes